MARVVIIVDSETGELIDVAGNGREGGRYKKFVKRMLSADGSQLDYGAAGGDSLTISKGGNNGSTINLLADTVNISDNLLINGKTVSDIAASGSTVVLDAISGAEGQVDVSKNYVTDPDTGESRKTLVISLDESVLGKLQMVEDAIGGLRQVVSREDIATVVEDLSVGDESTFEDVRGTLRVLLERLHALAGDESSGS